MKHRFSKDQPLVFDPFPANLDEIAKMVARTAQFIQRLSFVDRLINCIGLEFNDDFVSHQQISGIVAHDDAFELNLDFRLQFNLHIARLKLDLHCALTNLFQKSETKNIVNLNCRPDELLGDWLE